MDELLSDPVFDDGFIIDSPGAADWARILLDPIDQECQDLGETVRTMFATAKEQEEQHD